MVMRFVSDYSNEDPKPIGFEAHWMEKGEMAEMIFIGIKQGRI